MEHFKLTLNFVTPDSISEEHLEKFASFEDAVEESDEIAFRTVGFPLECWKKVDFGDGNCLYLFYPNEEDKSSRYKLAVLKEEEYTYE